MKFSTMLFSAIILLGYSNSLFAGLDEIADSTAMIHNVDWGITGTGVFVDQDDDNYYILSVGHLVMTDYEDGYFEKVDFVQINLLYDHYPSGPIDGKVEWCWRDNDFEKDRYLDISWISVPKELIIGFYKEPRITRIAKNYYLNDRVTTYGCPSIQWAFGTRGRIVAVNKERNVFILNPYPVIGQSGSGVFNENNEVVGIIIATNGVCMDIKSIQYYRKWFSIHKMPVSVEKKENKDAK